MTAVEPRDLSLNPQEIAENNDANLGLSLPTPLSPLASLDRCISNPLLRAYSNVSVSSDNEGAHFVPFGRGHNDIAYEHDNPTNPSIDFSSFGFCPLNMTPAFLPNDNDGVMQITPIHIVKSKVISNAQAVLGPLEDGDTDCTSSQIASSDLPSEGPQQSDAVTTVTQTDNNNNNNSNNTNNTDANHNNSNTFNAEAAEFVPNPNITAPPSRIGLTLPPLMQVMPLMNAMGMPMPMPPNLLPLQQIQINNIQQQMAMTQPSLLPMMAAQQAQIMQNNMNNTVQGSQTHHVQNKSYDAMVRNYMDATNANQSPDTENAHDTGQSLNDSPNYTRNHNDTQYRYNITRGQQRRGGTKYKRVTQQNGKNNIQNMDITEIIKLNLTLPALLKHNMICKFMKHQNGSRYVQERLKMASTELTTHILKHIIFKQKQLLSLSEDIFGNYVIQIFFENGTDEHHELLTKNLLYGNAYRLARSFYGCRVIQKAFDCISEVECKHIIKELANEGEKENKQDDEDEEDINLIHEAIICPNANHVIQKIITLKYDIVHIQFIIDCIDEDICFYSSHIFGCRIVQNIINYYGWNNDKKMLGEMVSKDNLLHLCQSQYGNYVIQHLLALSFDNDDCIEIKNEVVRKVFGNVMYLAKNKYGSNVVEKCLQKANDKQRDYLLDQILKTKHKNVLMEMVKHKYANYVIQKLLTFCNIKQQQRLIYQIERKIPNLRTLNYGKHIMDKIKKIKQSINQSPSNQKHYNY